jgi:outer membrane protein
VKREADIVKQKNILSKEELDKKVISLRKEITEFKKEKNSLFNKFQQQKLQKVNKMVDKLNKILSQYAADKSIDIIVQKKNIVIGKSELDITDAIMKVFNKQVKSL